MQRLSWLHWRAVDPIANTIELAKCWLAVTGLCGPFPETPCSWCRRGPASRVAELVETPAETPIQCTPWRKRKVNSVQSSSYDNRWPDPGHRGERAHSTGRGQDLVC
jgi:hypothetical protein